jgi:hypothetical protein
MMKKAATFLISFIVFISTMAQSTDDLDRKMGFNKFKLETTYTHYAKDLKFIFKGLNGDKFYEYTNNDVEQVAYYPIRKINLGFYRDSLYTISILFGAISTTDFSKIRGRLEELFGETNLIGAHSTNTFKYELGSQWDGHKVFMQLTKYSCDNETEVACQTELFLFSKKLKKELDYNSF